MNHSDSFPPATQGQSPCFVPKINPIRSKSLYLISSLVTWVLCFKPKLKYSIPSPDSQNHCPQSQVQTHNLERWKKTSLQPKSGNLQRMSVSSSSTLAITMVKSNASMPNASRLASAHATLIRTTCIRRCMEKIHMLWSIYQKVPVGHKMQGESHVFKWDQLLSKCVTIKKKKRLSTLALDIGTRILDLHQ